MRLTHSSRRAHRPAETIAERGAIVIEMAIVAIVLVSLLAGAFDYGMAWRAGLAVNEGARAGARLGSSVGNDVNADRSLLTSTRAALSSSGMLEEVERVIVFDAAASNGRVPAACITGKNSGECNIFTGDQFRAIRTDSPINSTTGCIDDSDRKAWCPNERIKVQLTADSIGVWIRVRYEYSFGMLGNALTIDRQAVMRLEP
jgi:Flp pilus assembly protein TadG